MTEPRQVGHRLRAKYAPRGASAELERTVPLADAEKVLLGGAMRLHRPGRLPRPVVVRLSQQRLNLLAHYAFQPDRVWDLPRGSVRGVQVVGAAGEVAWTSENGPATLKLGGWTGRAAPDHPLHDIHAVADTLRSWLDSSEGDFPAGPPHSHRSG